MSLPPAVETLIAELARLPGIGRRSAERMALDLVTSPEQRRSDLLAAVRAIGEEISICPRCGYFQSAGKCLVCTPGRDEALLLVVERPLDVIAIEKAGGYRGLYHVLGGHLSPLKGIGPEDIRLAELFGRLRESTVRELILATSPSVEGDATALYIARKARREGLSVTRLGRGVPMGASLEFSDAGTLRLALEGRRALDSP